MTLMNLDPKFIKKKLSLKQGSSKLKILTFSSAKLNVMQRFIGN